MIAALERDAPPEKLAEEFVARLRRLLRLRRDHLDELNENGVQLLDRAIFSVYCDCIDVGAGGDAQAALKLARLKLRMPHVD